MNAQFLGKVVLSGFFATFFMTIAAYMAPLAGFPEMDFAALLGSMYFGYMPPPGSGAWWVGMLQHFVDGSVIFALIYAIVAGPLLRGPGWQRGLVWGVILWLAAQVVAMPVLGAGFFSSASPLPVLAVLGSLIVHLIYGVILGALCPLRGPRAGRLP